MRPLKEVRLYFLRLRADNTIALAIGVLKIIYHIFFLIGRKFHPINRCKASTAIIACCCHNLSPICLLMAAFLIRYFQRNAPTAVNEKFNVVLRYKSLHSIVRNKIPDDHERHDA